MRKKFMFLKITFLIAALFSCTHSAGKNQKIELKSDWKFINKDNLQFARANFDDSQWDSIGVDKTWNKQGYPKYDGFGWYRIKVFIPSVLKQNASLKDSLIFHLGKIDDFDQVFLNGKLIGENLKNIPVGTPIDDTFKDLDHSFWAVPRRYALAVDDSRIKWDQENVIAVRVFNWGGAGGIYSGDLYLSMPDISEYLRMEFARSQFTFNKNDLKKQVTLKNVAKKYPLVGRFKILVRNNIDGSTIFSKDNAFHLAPKGKHTFTFRFPQQKQSAAVHYTVWFERSKVTVNEREGVPYILTPPVNPQPQINGAMVYGQRPGKPFLYRIAATGQRPMIFSAKQLPEGLTLDAHSGIIRGVARQKGTYPVVITASNALGSDTKTIRFIIGDQIALTPPMGWNSWNCWGLSVTQNRVYAAAKAFVEKGLAEHGWTYINIDDGWEIYGKSEVPGRKPNGEIRTNEKFPDMKKLGDDIHALGLKFGIYSSPGPLTCGKYTGSYRHEQQDALTFAHWGVDYLKYDLCSYRKFMKDTHAVDELMPPYQRMYHALQKVDRDIVYSICEYGFGKVWQWGAKVGGNLWRTTGDIYDAWERLYQIGFHQDMAALYAGPGHWNDPDMLIVGWVGWGENLHPTNLTPDEQYTHVSLWALLSAPLLLGCDLERLDDFTLNLLTNDEVLAIDQDPLGNQAVPVIKESDIQVYKKNLADGNQAIGIFNIGKNTHKYTLKFKDAGLTGKLKLRDVWRQKDLGAFDGQYSVTIPSHGVQLLKVFEEK